MIFLTCLAPASAAGRMSRQEVKYPQSIWLPAMNWAGSNCDIKKPKTIRTKMLESRLKRIALNIFSFTSVLQGEGVAREVWILVAGVDDRPLIMRRTGADAENAPAASLLST